MTIRTLGQGGAVVLGTSIDFEPSIGQTRTITVTADTVGALGSYLATLGTNVSYSGELREGGQIRIVYPPSSGWESSNEISLRAVAEADWELVPNVQTKDLRFFSTWGNDENVAKAWNAYRAGTLDKTVLDSGIYGSAGTVGYTFGSHLLKGTDSFEEESYVIRQTITANRESDLEASFTGVFTVVSPPTPNDYAKFTMTVLGTSYEWLKRPPSVRATSKGFQISQEWWGVKTWSASLYSGGSGIP